MSQTEEHSNVISTMYIIEIFCFSYLIYIIEIFCLSYLVGEVIKTPTEVVKSPSAPIKKLKPPISSK